MSRKEKVMAALNIEDMIEEPLKKRVKTLNQRQMDQCQAYLEQHVAFLKTLSTLCVSVKDMLGYFYRGNEEE